MSPLKEWPREIERAAQALFGVSGHYVSWADYQKRNPLGARLYRVKAEVVAEAIGWQGRKDE